MKLKTIIGTYWHWLLTAGFAVAVFCFWLFRLPFLMLAREQMQLFLWNTDYLSERLAVPGGLAQYLGELVVQFFLNPVAGACWYAVLLTAVQLLTWRLLAQKSRSSVSFLLSFVPSCMLWFLACIPNIPMTPVVAVLLTLGLMNLLPKARKARWVTACVLTPVGYWLLGPAIVLLALYAFHWLPLVLAVGCTVASVWVTPYPFSQVVRGIDYYWDSTEIGTYEEMEYDMLMRQQEWVAIARKYQNTATESLAIRNVALLAQYNLQRVSRRELMDGLVLTRQTLASISSAFLISELSLQIGMVNVSQRAAFEAMEAIPNYNKSARALRRLVETNLVTGQDGVALKYISILEETTNYRNWARKMKALVGHPEQLKSHKTYQGLKDVYENGEDVFFY